RLKEPEEIELVRLIAQCPGEIVAAAERCEPAGLTHYVYAVATQFHKFYNAHKVMVADEALMQARLSLCAATRTVIANMLALLKISAPEHM
ncbi:MAG: arginine--tRNA ligase, partial [Oscillospiraceae bacterium]|nr:arginine--tRNA ligase [Oscillospiraceae bacterium]